ncbi:MAG: hypothetical protein MZV63_59980 [Marinilabiliales bacterium]|nr:hypothetical protein [Marinilabiliales bacterium]
MVIRLSDCMRYSLSRKDEQPVPDSVRELENLRLYPEIEKPASEAGSKQREFISEECLGIKIPSLLLQPLYEKMQSNGGVHESTGTVTITTYTEMQRAACRNLHLEQL